MPTPVSALIHAATLVTAGLYLLVRSSPILEYSSTALLVITLVGASTAFFAATCGLVQNDLKRIIAFSTISQLGLILYLFVINFDFNISTYYILQNLIVPISTLSEALKKAKESKDNLSVIQPKDKFSDFNYSVKNTIKKNIRV